MAFQLSFESQHKYATREGNLNVRTILSTATQQVHCVAAIDTGATVCLFQRELGEALDLDLETGPFIQLSTLTGTLRAYGHEVTLQTFDGRAEFAWELLRSWHSPPGLHEGQVNADKLREWVTETRSRASERDRKVVADQHIGNVLFHYPSDPTDAAWPHVELRRLLEEVESDDIEQGIEMEQFNSRGVVTKAHLEGARRSVTSQDGGATRPMLSACAGREQPLCSNASRYPGRDLRRTKTSVQRKNVSVRIEAANLRQIDSLCALPTRSACGGPRSFHR